MLNRLSKAAAEADIYGTIYDLNGTTAYIVAIIFVMWYGKKLGVSIVKAVLSTVIVYLCSNYTMLAFIQIGSFLIRFSGNVVAFFIYIPLYCIFFSKPLNCSWKSMWDYIMCAPLIVHIVCRWGCVFMGCCRGFPSEWGIYNLRTDCIVFPIQIIESMIAFAILCAVLYRSKKRGYKADGYNVPIILISYGVVRFFLEYFHDNTKYFFGLSQMALHSILMVIVGIAAWYKLKKDAEKTVAVDER